MLFGKERPFDSRAVHSSARLVIPQDARMLILHRQETHTGYPDSGESSASIDHWSPAPERVGPHPGASRALPCLSITRLQITRLPDSIERTWCSDRQWETRNEKREM